MGNKGQFKKGNQLWKNLEYPGTRRKYTPSELWAKFLEYMEKNNKAYWSKQDFIKSGPGAGNIVYTDVPNPPSIKAFCIFSNISEQTFLQYYKSNGSKGLENCADYAEVSCTIRDTIQLIQVDGASAGVFNANIIARLTGLVDKKEVDVKTDYSDDDRRQMIQDILGIAKKDDGMDLV
jgi:hypothetical protein